MKKPVLALVLLLVIVAGHLTRSHLGGGDGDVSLATLRQTVDALGWRGPLAFFLVVTFRQFLMLPALLVLSVGGLCFGVVGGTVLGGAGLLISGALKFQLARGLLGDWIRGALGARAHEFERRVTRMGPLAIGVCTAHPLGILSPLHWGAGLTSLRFGAFLTAIAIGAPVRAFAVSSFGATLSEGASPAVIAGGIAGAALLALPLLSPRLRRLLFEGASTPDAAAWTDPGRLPSSPPAP